MIVTQIKPDAADAKAKLGWLACKFKNPYNAGLLLK